MKYSAWKMQYPLSEHWQLRQRTDISLLVATLLKARNMEEDHDIDALIYDNASFLHDSYLMQDMEPAISRIQKAIAHKEQVAVYGDYDVDGITSGCLMTHYLRSCGLSCTLYIPDRIDEGYGLNRDAISALHHSGVTLIITVDCGVTAIEETAYAASLGVDLIITDHHECSGTLPSALAVVNPKRHDCPYPNKDLAGVGVAFKLVCGLCGDASFALKQYADLVALGTIADVMPLLGENRYITKCGLSKLHKNPNIGLQALMEAAGVSKTVPSSTSVGFALAPRINAAGRLGSVQTAVSLLLCEHMDTAEKLALELCTLNQNRQKIEQTIWDEAVSRLGPPPRSTPIVLADANWHQGVVGIVASRLCDTYGVPTIMISLDGTQGKGSCRSAGGFNLYEALSACAEYLDSFGGHALAAGLNIQAHQIDNFSHALAAYYTAHPVKEGHTLHLDFCVESPDLLSLENIASLSMLEPYGIGNEIPRLAMCDCILTECTPIGGGKHLRLSVSKFGITYQCILFSRRKEALGVLPGAHVDIAFTPQINAFRGRKTVQLSVIDIRPACYDFLYQRIFSNLTLTPYEAFEYTPTRQDFAVIWKYLVSNPGTVSGIIHHIMPQLEEMTGCHRGKILICLLTLEELGILNLDLSGETIKILPCAKDKKVNLKDSHILSQLLLHSRSV